jgi:TatD DNase family protein
MKYIDTHCHLNFAAYNEDRDEVIQELETESVAGIVVGTHLDTSTKAVALAQQYPHLWAIVGLHPIHTVETFRDSQEIGSADGQSFVSRSEVFDVQQYDQLINESKKVIAIGECGFDYYHHDQETKQVQEAAFRAQIECACKHNLPLMLHVRPSQGSYDAYDDTLLVLREYQSRYPSLRGQLHFFAGTEEHIQVFIDLGFMISFTGVITFASEYKTLIKKVPLTSILTETDAPYVSPHPYRGKRNHPCYVKEVYTTIAECKDITVETLQEQVRKNVHTLYNISY